MRDIYQEIMRPGTEEKKPLTCHQIDESLCSRYPLNILIAEDNLVNQKLATSILSKMGYNAQAVMNGREAYELAKTVHFDIILMDIQMPEMTGIEATIKIKQDISVDRQPLIIALTANAMIEDKDKCINAGMVDYMSKPINLNILHNVLIKWGNYISSQKLQ